MVWYQFFKFEAYFTEMLFALKSTFAPPQIDISDI